MARRSKAAPTPAKPTSKLAAKLRATLAAQRPGKSAGATLYAERVLYAKQRALRVLQARVVTYRRELERQVCEVGYDFRKAKDGERTEPHHFSDAIKSLKAEGAIKEHVEKIANTNYVFWISGRAAARAIAPVLRRKLDAATVYERITHMPSNGWHAEGVHHKAILSDDAWLSVGWKGGVPIRQLGRYSIEDDKLDVDLAAFHAASKVPIVAQVKNTREWFYPPDHAVWHLLGAAARLHAVPVLIARRLPERTFAFMKSIGGFAFPSLKLILPPELKDSTPILDLPTMYEAATDLGFHSDIDFIHEPLPRHRLLWSGELASSIEEMHERFLELRTEIERIAFDEGLRGDHGRGRVSGKGRREITDTFILVVRERHREEALARWREDHPRPEHPRPEFPEEDEEFEPF